MVFFYQLIFPQQCAKIKTVEVHIMRKIRKYKRKKRKRIIILSSLTLLLFLCVGYAAFQTNLKITAKVNIVCTPITINDLKNTVISSGDGLHKDIYREDTYVYAGANPNNYIYFNNEVWRIILIMNSYIKIIREEPLNTPMNFDYSTNRFSGGKYCSSANSQGSNGCNLWGSVNETEIHGVSYANSFPYRTDNYSYALQGPDDISYINNYLNIEYYNLIDANSKKYIEKYYYDYGLLPTMVNSSSYNINDLLNKSSYIFGKYLVSLPKATDYIIASTYTGCGNYYYYSSETCTKAAAKQNWMYDSNHNLWTINPTEYLYNGQYYTQKVAVISKDTGGIIQSNAYQNVPNNYVKPVLFLNPEIKLCGSGHPNNPYYIYEDS